MKIVIYGKKAHQTKKHYQHINLIILNVYQYIKKKQHQSIRFNIFEREITITNINIV